MATINSSTDTITVSSNETLVINKKDTSLEIKVEK